MPFKSVLEHPRQVENTGSKPLGDSNVLSDNDGNDKMTANQLQTPETTFQETNNNHASPVECIPKSTLEQIQKRYGWNDEQMLRVLETFRQQTIQGQSTPAPVQGGWSPHAKLNFIVYVIMISVMIFVMNQEYGNIFVVLMAKFFPREAKLLGMTVPFESRGTDQ